MYFQILIPLIKQFNDTVDQHWGIENRSSTDIPTIPLILDYHTMMMSISSLCNQITDVLSLLHVDQEKFRDIDFCFKKLQYMSVYSTGLYGAKSDEITSELIGYYIIINLSTPEIFHIIKSTIISHHANKNIDEKYYQTIKRYFKSIEQNSEIWEKACKLKNNTL